MRSRRGKLLAAGIGEPSVVKALAALLRRDIGLEAPTVTVGRAQAELQDGRLFDKAPKSAAGVRSVSFPAELLDAVAHHLEH
ncbi:hypothetical protein GCM10010260_49230 [Streptomyces filipinensis]|uniref:Uncharacterized protein n=1 Tax=Streptomyces filipinensis TaxID=66887 RepID=A0A918IEQ4_9ACTN|nr:hypothetical protein [Streptomyces filipinensis]GGV05962.1 hypothetical protein GCM10010260_49230 [Streptomyces filipinensis]